MIIVNNKKQLKILLNIKTHSLILFIIAMAAVISYAGEVKLTTYYPAPYGEYDSLVTRKASVGDTDADGNITSADLPENDNDLLVSGNVGIGTANPQNKLHITGANYPAIYIDSTDSTGGAIGYGTNSLLKGWATGTGGNNGEFRIWRYTGTGSADWRNNWDDPSKWSTDLLINSSGNVGIGTTDPQRPLHISDVMRLQPRNSAPTSPSEGDLYVDSSFHHIYCYTGSPRQWKQLDN